MSLNMYFSALNSPSSLAGFLGPPLGGVVRALCGLNSVWMHHYGVINVNVVSSLFAAMIRGDVIWAGVKVSLGYFSVETAEALAILEAVESVVAAQDLQSLYLKCDSLSNSTHVRRCVVGY